MGIASERLARFLLYKGSGRRLSLRAMRQAQARPTIETHEQGSGRDKLRVGWVDRERRVRRKRMKDGPLVSIEREVLGWPGVIKKRDEDGPGGVGVTGYRYGEPRTGGPQIGHVHDDGHADFRFPKEVRDELIRSGRAIPHPAFPRSRTTASYRIRSTEDVPGAIELFRMSYERAKARAEQRAPRA